MNDSCSDQQLAGVQCCCTVSQAVRYGHLAEMKQLTASGHPLDAADNRGWRPLHEAAAGNFIECLDFLLQQHGVCVDWQSFDGRSALLLAAAEGHASCVQLLLQYGADVNLPDCMQESPLLAAVKSGNVRCIKLLLQHEAVNVNCQNYNKSTPLHLAVAAGRADVTKLLLQCGARADVLDELDISPLFTAAQYGRMECLQLLLDGLHSSGKMEVVNVCAEDGASALFLAAQEGHTDCVNLLLQNGADANIATTDPVALPLHAALQFNHIDCVEALLPATDQSRLSKCSASPYYFSMMHDDVRATCSLISAAVDVDAGFEATDDDEYQPKVLRYFNNEVRFGRRFSPLVIVALYEYSLQHADALLAAGACPDARRPCRVPPLLPALDMFNVQLVESLVAAGVSVNVYHRRVAGNMALIVCLHNWRGLRTMLRCGAEPDSLFGKPAPPSAVTSSGWSDDECAGEDYECEFGALQTPVPFWRMIAEARYVMTRRGVTVSQVLHQLLQFIGPVVLDQRLAGYVDSADDWTRLRAVAETPRPLAHLCRLQIRRHFTPRQLVTDDAVLSLPLPLTLLSYLLHNE